MLFFLELVDDLCNESTYCHCSDMETRGKQNDFEDDEDSPPPGWEFNTLSRALPSKPPSNTAGHICSPILLHFVPELSEQLHICVALW